MAWMKTYGKKFEDFKSILNKDNPKIIEIGAHFGEDSVRFSETFTNAEIFSFEPDPRCVKVFKKYVKDKNIKLFPIALSDKNGTAEFYQSYDNNIVDFVPNKYDWIDVKDYNDNKLSNSGASSLKPGYGNNLDKIIVETKRFDDWHSENNIGDIDLVWIDVQGAEKEVLDGIGDTINNIGLIWIEYGELVHYEGAMTREETISYLNNKGFIVIDSLSSSTSTGDLLLYNSRKLTLEFGEN
jgi:2-O-methyltransferase